MIINLERLDIHPADQYNLEASYEVDGNMLLSEFTEDYVISFLPNPEGIVWTMRAKIGDELVDLGCITESSNIELYIKDEALKNIFLGEEGNIFSVYEW